MEVGENGNNGRPRRGRGIVLFSGGLDSILACKVLQDQGVEVVAVKFCTPFFGQAALADPGREKERVARRWGIPLEIVEISEEYIEMLREPPHGYGKHFNPCLDCKILMVRKALELLPRFSAQFVATGEVIGQRPMSQRRDAMNIVARDSGARGKLLRPLCAHHFPPTEAEEAGLVDRSRLLSLAGRGRKAQMALAEQFGIEGYPTPAGGCVLTDPVLSQRFRWLFETREVVTPNDCLLAQEGRHFHLPGGALLVMGRNREENRRVRALGRRGDLFIQAHRRPGPTGLLRWGAGEEQVRLAAALVARYLKGAGPGTRVAMRVEGGDGPALVEVEPLPPDAADALRA